MASAISHAVAAAGIGAGFYRRSVPVPVWIAGISCAVIPDLDVIGFRFGIRYGDFWGHRGFTHSLFFAAFLAVLVAATIVRYQSAISRVPLLVYLFLVHRKSWLARRDDERRHGSSILLAVREQPTFSAMEADCRLSHRNNEIL